MEHDSFIPTAETTLMLPPPGVNLQETVTRPSSAAGSSTARSQDHVVLIANAAAASISLLTLEYLELHPGELPRLGFSGPADGRLSLETSSDLANWTAVPEIRRLPTELQFPDAADLPRRFYRLRLE